jgi:uncharacterized membrane protein
MAIIANISRLARTFDLLADTIHTWLRDNPKLDADDATCLNALARLLEDVTELVDELALSVRTKLLGPPEHTEDASVPPAAVEPNQPASEPVTDPPKVEAPAVETTQAADEPEGHSASDIASGIDHTLKAVSIEAKVRADIERANALAAEAEVRAGLERANLLAAGDECPEPGR